MLSSFRAIGDLVVLEEIDNELPLTGGRPLTLVGRETGS